ncbi:MAG: glycosyltransferase [Anaeromyxobacter sp.]
MVSTPFVAVPPPAYGGTELIVHALVRALARAGHEVAVFATGDSRVPGLRARFPGPIWPPDPYAELLHCQFAVREILRRPVRRGPRPRAGHGGLRRRAAGAHGLHPAPRPAAHAQPLLRRGAAGALRGHLPAAGRAGRAARPPRGAPRPRPRALPGGRPGRRRGGVPGAAGALQGAGPGGRGGPAGGHLAAGGGRGPRRRRRAGVGRRAAAGAAPAARPLDRVRPISPPSAGRWPGGARCWCRCAGRSRSGWSCWRRCWPAAR